MPNSMSTNSVSLWRVRAGTNATDNTATSGALLLSTKRSGADLLLQSVFSCSWLVLDAESDQTLLMLVRANKDEKLPFISKVFV